MDTDPSTGGSKTSQDSPSPDNTGSSPEPLLKRREPLPWQEPKPLDDDPEAHARISAILASSSYLQADRDVEFLNRDDVRGLRLQADYLKPELFLREYGIMHTIVVFGGTRIRETHAAERRVRTLREALNNDPDNEELARKLTIAWRVLAKSSYYDVARQFGNLVAQHSGQLCIMTGGGPGIMEAANRGAYDAGAKTIGLNIHLPHEQYPNPYITPELSFSFHYFAMRKLHFLLRAKALVAFPGGYGTFDEVFEALTLVQTRKIKPLPIILVGGQFWKQAFNVGFLVEEGVIDPEDRELFRIAETAEEIWTGILDWYRANGEPLIPGL